MSTGTLVAISALLGAATFGILIYPCTFGVAAAVVGFRRVRAWWALRTYLRTYTLTFTRPGEFRYYWIRAQNVIRRLFRIRQIRWRNPWMNPDLAATATGPRHIEASYVMVPAFPMGGSSINLEELTTFRSSVLDRRVAAERVSTGAPIFVPEIKVELKTEKNKRPLPRLRYRTMDLEDPGPSWRERLAERLVQWLSNHFASKPTPPDPFILGDAPGDGLVPIYEAVEPSEKPPQHRAMDLDE